MKSKPNDRALPPKITHLIEAEFKLRFTFRERLRILVGQNVRLTYLGYAAHSPGAVIHKMKHEVVNEL